MRSAFKIVPHSRSLRSVLPLHRHKAHKVFYHLAANDQAKANEIFDFFLGHEGYLELLNQNGLGYGSVTLGE